MSTTTLTQQPRIIAFGDVTPAMGFSAKALNTALCHQMSEELGKEVADILPDNIVFHNPDGANFSGVLFREHLRTHKLEGIMYSIMDAYNAEENNEINVFELVAQNNLVMPAAFMDKWCTSTVILDTDNYSELMQAIVLSFPPSQEIVNGINYHLLRLKERYGDRISIIFRSAATIGEDEQGDNVDPNKKAVMGAGKHSSLIEEQYRNGSEYATLDSCTTAFMMVEASVFSFQACGDYRGTKDNDGTWLHSKVDMEVIMMVVIHSKKYGSALAFSGVVDGIYELTWGDKVMGEELVGGHQQFPLINAIMLPDGTIKSNIISGEIQASTKVLDAKVKVVSILERKYHIKIDSEWADGPLWENAEIIYMACVQFRTFVPAQHARKTEDVTMYEVLSTPEVEPLVTGVSIGEMCGYGEALIIHNLAQLRKANVRGKMLFVPEAYTELLAVIKNGAAGVIVDPEALKAHFTLNAEEEIPLVVGAHWRGLNIVDGTPITMLHGALYVGDFRSHFQQFDFNLRTDVRVPNGVKIGYVEGNPSGSRSRKMFPYSRLGIAHDNMLARVEAFFWNGDITPLLNWIHFDKIDRSTEEGQKAAAQIEAAMRTYQTNDPLIACVKRVAGVAFPLAAYYQSQGKACEMRMYGARIDEDTPSLTPGFLPHEPNPICGYNGFAMYAEEWGEKAADFSFMFLKELEEYGCHNSTIFVPNMSTLKGMPELLEKAESYGIDLSQRGVKIMVECARMLDGDFITYPEEELINDEYVVVAPSLIDLRAQLSKKYGKKVKFSTSYGFNDANNSVSGGDVRHLKMRDGRGNMNTRYWDRKLDNFEGICREHDIDTTSCGLPSKVPMRAMMRNGASQIGLPVGKRMIDGANELALHEQKLAEEASLVSMN